MRNGQASCHFSGPLERQEGLIPLSFEISHFNLVPCQLTCMVLFLKLFFKKSKKVNSKGQHCKMLSFFFLLEEILD